MRYRWSPVTARIGVSFALVSWILVTLATSSGGMLWENPGFGIATLTLYLAGLLLDTLWVKIGVPLLAAVVYLFPTWLVITDQLLHDDPPFTRGDLIIGFSEITFSVAVTALLMTVAVGEREHAEQ